MIDLKEVARLINKITAHHDEWKPQERGDKWNGIISIKIDFLRADKHVQVQIADITSMLSPDKIKIEPWDFDEKEDHSEFIAHASINGIEFFSLMSKEDCQ